jgi:hypothetical protein
MQREMHVDLHVKCLFCSAIIIKIGVSINFSRIPHCQILWKPIQQFTGFSIKMYIQDMVTNLKGSFLRLFIVNKPLKGIILYALCHWVSPSQNIILVSELFCVTYLITLIRSEFQWKYRKNILFGPWPFVTLVKSVDNMLWWYQWSKTWKVIYTVDTWPGSNHHPHPVLALLCDLRNN